MNEIQRMITALSAGEPLQHEDWLRLIADASEDDRRFSRDLACKRAQARFGRRVFFRGIIEFTNYCKNDCYYCGIRCSNRCLSRYRLTEDEILSCCEEGYRLGYRTFVLQGGEDGWWTDEKITALVRRIRAQYPDCAITLSIGEKSCEVYQAFFDAGADRYLLRHETANEAHYAKIHPARQTLSNRTRCLRDLKDIGYQTGAGMMIGAPYQTAETLAQDMEFLADLRPEMVGMGPFLPPWKRRADALPSEPGAAAAAGRAASGNDRARHPGRKRAAAGRSVRVQRGHAEPVSDGSAAEISALRQQGGHRRRRRKQPSQAARADAGNWLRGRGRTRRLYGREDEAMIKIAVYGKGGIGKSTTVSNLSAAFSEKGLRVMQIGCDPKADSTVLLTHGEKMPTALQLMRERKNDFTLSDMAREGFGGVVCVEAGGPTPGLGCAGRGIIAALEKLEEKGAYEAFRPDVVFYDVLGDVVCGGFSMPMRAGYADRVFIVTSGENMALHAAANIAMAVENFRGRGYASLGGLILNRRNVKNEEEKVVELAGDISSQIVGSLSLSDTVHQAEELSQTVIEAFPDSPMAAEYRALAENVLRACEVGVC